jgi:hypothetical protein
METNTEAWVNGDRAEIAEGPFATGELARQAIADGKVIPVAGLDMTAFATACWSESIDFERVTVTIRHERVTGQETDSELFVDAFFGVRQHVMSLADISARESTVAFAGKLLRRIA